MTRLAVVGAGPVGLTAALAGARAGLDVTLFEAEPVRSRPGSRAIYVHGTTLGALERIRPGLGGELAGNGLVWGAKRTLWAGREVYHRSYPPPRSGLPPFSSLPQSVVEEHLEHACAQEGVTVRRGVRVNRVETDTAGAVVVDDTGGRTRVAHVIGADGPRSTVRAALGIALDGTSSRNDFVVVDVADPRHRLPSERVFHYRHPDMGGRNVLLVPFRGGWRVDLQTRSEEEAARFAEQAPTWVDRLLPGHEVTWVSRYRFHQRVADRFVGGDLRVLLAGEAAHLFPPFGARGMNSGIADAVEAVAAVSSDSVASYGERRRTSALTNRNAAGAACAHLLAERRTDRARQRGAALIAPFSRRAGRWLDSAPFGPVLARARY